MTARAPSPPPEEPSSPPSQQNTTQKPSPFCADTSSIRTVAEYGSGNPPIKYQVYKADDPISLLAPVKSELQFYSLQGFYGAPGSSGDQVYSVIKFKEDIGLFKNGMTMAFGPIEPSYAQGRAGAGWAHAQPIEVAKGGTIGVSVGASNIINIIINPKFTDAIPSQLILEGDRSPRPFVDFSLGNADEDGFPNSGGQTGTTSVDVGQGVDVGSIAKSAAFSTFLQMPGIFNYVESNSLTGQRSLMNDQPLLPFIQQLCMACLRQFMSTPSGDFFAFYPDYFGGFGKAPYWHIEDIEILNGSIELSDDNLATHVYVVGDIVGPPSAAEGGGAGNIDMLDKINTGGVVNIFNAFMADFLNGNTSGGTEGVVDSSKYPTLAQKEDAINFLRKYGARPYFEDQPAVRAPIYESFLAYQKFCLKWSEQFKTQFEFTFMPELFPGGIVAFPEHGLQCYVASVTHNCSYENGFTTSAELMAPAAYKGGSGDPVDPDKAWVHAGMIRQWPKDGAEGKFKDATDKDPAAAEENQGEND